MLTTQAHLELALEHLDVALIEFVDAKRTAEFYGWPTWYLERIDVLKRATANLRKKMAEGAVSTGQEELEFSDTKGVSYGARAQ